MSLNNLPSKMEVMGWSPHSLADYMKALKFSGCDKVVKEYGISGAQFMQMTGSDIQVFPAIYNPIITKIQREINKGEQKRAFDFKSKAQKSPNQAYGQEKDVWDSDDFEDESDNDYEGPNLAEEERHYECDVTEQQTDEQQDRDMFSEDIRELPESAGIVKQLKPPRTWGCHSRAPGLAPTPAARKPSFSFLKKLSRTSQDPTETPDSQPNLTVDRKKKPEHPVPLPRDPMKSKGSTEKASHSRTRKPAPPNPPISTDTLHRGKKAAPPSPVEEEPPCENRPKQDLDPRWYGGKMTRYEAESTLRRINKDGTFLVRDSSHMSTEHPYTLMLLKQGKVYNIQIRNQGDSYSLGTGFRNNQCFPGVTEMITYHTHSPLLLIDATNRSSKAQIQCCLLYPAGL